MLILMATGSSSIDSDWAPRPDLPPGGVELGPAAEALVRHDIERRAELVEMAIQRALNGLSGHFLGMLPGSQADEFQDRELAAYGLERLTA
jgi:hypothetical protein